MIIIRKYTFIYIIQPYQYISQYTNILKLFYSHINIKSKNTFPHYSLFYKYKNRNFRILAIRIMFPIQIS